MKKLFYNGNIITMVRPDDAPEAVLVENGRIRFVGDEAKARELMGKSDSRMTAEVALVAGAEAPVPPQEDDVCEIDLAGRTLMPSFIDPHSHISLYSQYVNFPDLSGCTSFDEIVDTLQAYLASHPMEEGQTLFAVNYDHNFLKEQAHPTRDVLDRVSAEIPIWIYHTSSHMGVANTALLRKAGLPDDAPEPQGGHYGRYADGTINGYVEEIPALMPILMMVFGEMKSDPVQQLLAVQDIYLSYGVTTAQDGSSSVAGVEGFLQMAENGVFKIDVVSYPMYTDKPAELMKKHPEINQKYYKRFKVGGGKILLDGSPQARTAWLSRPYEGEESYCGYQTLEDSVVEAVAQDAIDNGYQLLAHTNGDAASEQYIRCYESALHGRKNDLRPVMVHCQTVREDQLDRMVRLDMIPSIFVAHTYYWGDVHLKNLGQERGSRISPVKSALNRGLVYNFHQDCPILPPDMFRTIWCAVNRITRGGAEIGPEQRIGVFDALRGVTINAAYAYHEEHEKGTIEAGKLADLIVVDRNPLTTDPMELKDIQVLETMKEGVTLYRR